jgi:hypothetical protein
MRMNATRDAFSVDFVNRILGGFAACRNNCNTDDADFCGFARIFMALRPFVFYFLTTEAQRTQRVDYTSFK